GWRGGAEPRASPPDPPDGHLRPVGSPPPGSRGCPGPVCSREPAGSRAALSLGGGRRLDRCPGPRPGELPERPLHGLLRSDEGLVVLSAAERLDPVERDVVVDLDR